MATQFEYPLTVRGYELDSFGHVNNAVYLNYMEQARWEILLSTGALSPLQQERLFLVVVKADLRYCRENKLNDRLVVKTRVRKADPYLLFLQTIYSAETGRKTTEGRIWTLLVDEERQPRDLPASLDDLAAGRPRSSPSNAEVESHGDECI